MKSSRHVRLATGAVLAIVLSGGPASAAESKGIWISREEIMALPMAGSAWDALKAQADQFCGTPNLRDQDETNNVCVLAKALVYVRTGVPSYRDEVVRDCMAAIDTEVGGRTLALGRKLEAYVVAADLVGLDAADDQRFRDWLRRTLTEPLDGLTLQQTHERRPNNWGTHAGDSRVAVAIYLGDREELARCAQVFKGWLGDWSSYAGFNYGSLSWQSDPSRPVGINPKGAMKDGVPVDGVMPDDMRRGCDLQMPPCRTNYPWSALQGAVAQAEMLSRRGYDAWNWQDQALRRAVQYLYFLSQRYPNDGWWASGDDEWIVWLVNAHYGTRFPARLPARPGKNTGWTDWTHGASHGVTPDLTPKPDRIPSSGIERH